LLELSSTAADSSQRPVLPSPPCFRLDAWMSVHRPPPWPDWDASCEEIARFNLDMLDVCYRCIHRRWMFSSRGEWWGSL